MEKRKEGVGNMRGEMVKVMGEDERQVTDKQLGGR